MNNHQRNVNGSVYSPEIRELIRLDLISEETRKRLENINRLQRENHNLPPEPQLLQRRGQSARRQLPEPPLPPPARMLERHDYNYLLNTLLEDVTQLENKQYLIKNNENFLSEEEQTDFFGSLSSLDEQINLLSNEHIKLNPRQQKLFLPLVERILVLKIWFIGEKIEHTPQGDDNEMEILAKEKKYLEGDLIEINEEINRREQHIQDFEEKVEAELERVRLEEQPNNDIRAEDYRKILEWNLEKIGLKQDLKDKWEERKKQNQKQSQQTINGTENKGGKRKNRSKKRKHTANRLLQKKQERKSKSRKW